MFIAVGPVTPSLAPVSASLGDGTGAQRVDQVQGPATRDGVGVIGMTVTGPVSLPGLVDAGGMTGPASGSS